MTPEHWMTLALEKARAGIALGQTPFAAAIVRGDELVACEHNRVWANTDITAHGEVTAIRAACAALGTIDLSDCDIYSTCEPCPMCFAACHWARFRTIFYGASIADAQAAGFSELTLSNRVMKQIGGSPIQIVPGVLRGECSDLFREWVGRVDRRTY